MVPTLQKVQSVTRQLDPALRVLDFVIPGFNTAIRDLLAHSEQGRSVVAVADAFRALNQLDVSVACFSGTFQLGTFELVADVPRFPAGTNLLAQVGGAAANYLRGLTGIGSDLRFPVLEDPNTLYRLFTSQPASLFTFTPPEYLPGCRWSFTID